jgi:hypothetical protein
VSGADTVVSEKLVALAGALAITEYPPRMPFFLTIAKPVSLLD